MKVAFRLAKTSGPIGRVIGWLTGKYCHVEMVFGSLDDANIPEQIFVWISADWEGIRATMDITGNPDKWDFVDLAGTYHKGYTCYRWCRSQIGVKYDFLGLFSFILGWLGVREDPRLFYCPEFCAKALVVAGVIEPVMGKISPTRLYNILIKRIG